MTPDGADRKPAGRPRGTVPISGEPRTPPYKWRGKWRVEWYDVPEHVCSRTWRSEQDARRAWAAAFGSPGAATDGPIEPDCPDYDGTAEWWQRRMASAARILTTTLCDAKRTSAARAIAQLGAAAARLTTHDRLERQVEELEQMHSAIEREGATRAGVAQAADQLTPGEIERLSPVC